MNYLGQWSDLTLIRQDGTTRLAAEVLRDVPYVIFLFGASWNGETAAFFPLLEEFYERHHTAKGFEVVYISRDYTKTDMMRGFLSTEQQQQQQRTSFNSPDSPAGAASLQRSKTSSFHEEKPTQKNKGAGTPPPPSASSSSPPPLKRVAELAPAKSTNNFSGSSPIATMHAVRINKAAGGVYSGGIWAVPYEHVGVVGVPLLYHLRVFTYPGVIVCRNRPPHPSITPVLLLSAQGVDAPEGKEGAATGVANAPQRRERTPRIAHRVCQPDVITIAGRFMMESEDVAGDNFPWARMGSHVRFAALFFFAIVASVLGVVLSVVLPAVATLRHAKKATAASRSAV